MTIEERIPLVESILGRWKESLKADYTGYANHVYRMIHFCFALQDCNAEERDKVLIAACFHDIGLWTRGTLDYLPPSIAAARDYLEEHDARRWIPEVELMIDMHHKLRPYRDARYPLVEPFRKGDLVDFSLGSVKCGLPGELVRQIRKRFPNAGFHAMLARRAAAWIVRHPANPLPIAKW